jgi:hypothetical protein
MMWIDPTIVQSRAHHNLRNPVVSCKSKLINALNLLQLLMGINQGCTSPKLIYQESRGWPDF